MEGLAEYDATVFDRLLKSDARRLADDRATSKARDELSIVVDGAVVRAIPAEVMVPVVSEGVVARGKPESEPQLRHCHKTPPGARVKTLVVLPIVVVKDDGAVNDLHGTSQVESRSRCRRHQQITVSCDICIIPMHLLKAA